MTKETNEGVRMGATSTDSHSLTTLERGNVLTIRPAPTVLKISNGAGVILMCNADGTIEVGEAYTPTEAADYFIETVLRPAFARMIAQERARHDP